MTADTARSSPVCQQTVSKDPLRTDPRRWPLCGGIATMTRSRGGGEGDGRRLAAAYRGTPRTEPSSLAAKLSRMDHKEARISAFLGYLVMAVWSG